MQDCGGGTETALVGMLMTSAAAIFFSCSGATGFSEIRFDSESSVFVRDPYRLLHWTDEAGEGYVSSSFFGAELSIFTLLPERSVRKTL